MIAALANHLWQSTLFAIAVWIFTLAFRRNRAHVRFHLWLCASVKFLVPFVLLVSLGGNLGFAPVAKNTAPLSVSATVLEISQPFPERGLRPVAPSRPQTRGWLPALVVGVWACGSVVIAIIRLRDWRRIKAAVHASSPMKIVGNVEVRLAPGLLEPGVAGWVRPILLLPERIDEYLNPDQLTAVLAHELCHIRRRDNLTAAIHMLVEALFWFHPLVWWISARLMQERERACDEEVLMATGDAKAYADAILTVCKRYVESPLPCVSSVTGSNIRKRIEAIMMNQKLPELSLARKFVLATAGLAALTLPILIGVFNTPFASAQSGERARFLTASIRPSADCGEGGSRVARIGDDKRKSKKGDEGRGILRVRCAILGGDHGLIQQSYVVFATGEINVRIPSPSLTGGPDWLNSEAFDIEATVDGNPTREKMLGPMMQILLEERFKLSVRRETKDSPAYALVAAESPRLQPFREGSCTPIDLSQPLPMRYVPGTNPCGFFVGVTPTEGSVPVAAARGITLNDFAKLLSLAVEWPVVDATGIAGRYDFRIEFEPDSNTPRVLELRSANSARPTLLSAIQQQYGLKLVPSRAPREFLVVEHAEKPEAN